jgi:D-alanine-D-alanine ligase-like ATP-grasp enzyme
VSTGPIEDLVFRMRRRAYRASRMVSTLLGRQKTVYVWDRVPYYEAMWRAAAEHLDLELVPLSKTVWEVRGEGRTLSRINNCYVELDDPVTLYIAADKALTYRLLERAELPVPAHATFTRSSLDVLRAFVGEHPGPFVVKPSSGTGSGIGVTTHLTSYRACARAAALASLHCRDILVEQFVPGEVYRLLFIGGEFMSAVCRRGLRVTGDGHRSLGELLAMQHGEQVGRGAAGDRDFVVTTAAQGLSVQSVPAAGETVLVKSVASTYRDVVEIRTVYTHDVTEEVGQPLIDEARRAALALRSDFCGVDVITMDGTVSLCEGKGVVGEINTTPGLHHHYGLEGPARSEPMAETVLRFILARESGSARERRPS